MNNLPVYKMTISDNVDEMTGVTVISFVNAPAIEVNFLQFSKDSEHPMPIKMSIQDEDKRIVTGPVLIADLPIYRKDATGEYYVYADKECIYQIVQKFFKTQRGNNVNVEHSGMLIPGVYMFESFVTDAKRGIGCPSAYAGLPDGTWFGSFKVDNDEVWAEVKAGKFKGFSIEGLFDFIKQPVNMSVNKDKATNPLQIYNDLNSLLNQVNLS